MSPVDVYLALRLQLETQLGAEQTTRAGTMILLGQMALETGRFKASMNYNLGGVKCGPTWEGCWQHFTTTEHVSPEAAQDYIDHAPEGSKVERIGTDDEGRAILRFIGRHPVNKFRAYENLDAAVASHVKFLLGKRYRHAVHLAMDGQPDNYAAALRVAGYYTGDAKDYARSVRQLAREYDHAMPPDAPKAEPSAEVVSVAASTTDSPSMAPPGPKDEAPQVPIPPPVAPLPQIGAALQREEPRPWWVRLLVWLVELFSRRP